MNPPLITLFEAKPHPQGVAEQVETLGVFDGAFAVAVIRGDVRTSYDSWEIATPHVEIGDHVRAYMEDGTTEVVVLIRREEPTQGLPIWRAVSLPH
jgi:hypothetical protein